MKPETFVESQAYRVVRERLVMLALFHILTVSKGLSFSGKILSEGAEAHSHLAYWLAPEM